MAGKIYTKQGDQGTTILANNQKIAKDSLQINACGTVDELTSYLGLAAQYLEVSALQQKIVRIQTELQILNALLATAAPKQPLTTTHLETLEDEIDQLSQTLPQLAAFIIPGGGKAAAQLQVARTICRRAERAVVALNSTSPLPEIIIPYLNRLSDWLFIAALTEEKHYEETK